MKIKFKSLNILFFIFILAIPISTQDKTSLHIKSTKEVGQIEIGSPYIGIEIHKSFPMLNRISFYYPKANSIDISNDYWKRENFRIMSVGIKSGNSPKKILGNEIYEVDQTPYSVSFSKQDDGSEIKITYEFCKNEPAMVVTYLFTNISKEEKDYEIFTKLETILRTSHTYNLKENAYTESENAGATLRINYQDIETGNTQIFILNAGIQPSSFTSSANINKKFSSFDDLWLNTNTTLPNTLIREEEKAKPIAAFIYNKKLKPNETIKIVQIIGSSLFSEGKEKTDYLLANYQKEIDEYEDFILNESLLKNPITTGDEEIDFTSQWSKAILTTNAHYLNGKIVPMPAQAEYNFYFTHDALLTDLAAVNFDLSRVKNDLQFIISLADTDKTIPHAYYWKDSTFKTEFAGTENWNHFWFTLVCTRYFRHSGDKEFLNQLYPFIEKSIQTALKNKGENDLMWSFRPDWWDIGNNFGPRAYMTILAIRALREFNFLSSLLEKENSKLQSYEELANRINKNLIDSLWDDSLNYLISYFEDGTKDQHIYMGSLLASHFNLLDEDKDQKLLVTAKENLLDEKLGIYTLWPMDLHKLIDYMKFAGNEAGDPYYYANGGIWPHGNAWYALGLINNGFKEEAYSFVKNIMTLEGIINSPNGQPALYEYRISDKTKPEFYGKIDKPQFLWAGGWYFYTLYNLFGLRENEWNILFDPYIPEELDKINLTVTIKGIPVDVNISGKGKELSSILFDEKEIPSAVVPENIKNLKKINLKLGKTLTPYISSANVLIHSPKYDKKTKTLEFDLESFEGHLVEIEIVSPFKNQKVFINGNEIKNGISEKKKNELNELQIKHLNKISVNHYSVTFK
ncbi:MAG TPA: amylo-alpha-1,6-glucosidase [Ignavibacteriaceae bacterium]|nr:amylo-alpha-1,6-glucosidase [Ignavibacteriaceae bacterium]